MNLIQFLYTFKIMQEWKLLAMVLDRLVLYLFGSAFLFGTMFIFLQAPSLYQNQRPFDKSKFCNIMNY